jgi:hypothetical protein
MTAAPAELADVIGVVMGEVLARAPLLAVEDFFDAGGDSVHAVEVLQRLLAAPALASLVRVDELASVLLEAIFEDASPGAIAQACMSHVQLTSPGPRLPEYRH